MPVMLPKNIRDITISKLQKIGIQTTVNYRPLHKLFFFKRQKKYKTKRFPNAESIGNEVISLPFYPSMTNKTINYVCRQLDDIIRNL